MFGPNSRYFGLETAKRISRDGKEVAFVSRRTVPQPERFAGLYDHVVQHGERLDHIAFASMTDAEQYWRICDANRAMRPDELTDVVGKRLRITLPQDIPGPANG